MKRFLSALLCALIICVMAAPACAAPQVVSPDEYFYVLDKANVLSEQTRMRIVYNNDALYEACGAQIVFVTLSTTGMDPIGDYAVELFNQWGIGSAEENNGVLVLLCVADEDYYYLQGRGLEDSLTTGEMGELADRYLEPYFAQGEYDQGCAAYFDALFERVSAIYNTGLSVHDAGWFEEDATDTPQSRTGDEYGVSYHMEYGENGFGASYHMEYGESGFGVGGFSLMEILIALVVVIIIIRDRKSVV